MFERFRLHKRSVVIKNGEVFVNEEKRDLTPEQYAALQSKMQAEFDRMHQDVFDELDQTLETPVVPTRSFRETMKEFLQRVKLWPK